MKIKDVLVVYLPQRVVVFPLHLYFDKLLSRVLDRLYEWNLLQENKKITGKEKYFNFFLEKEIQDILLEIKIVYKELNLKIFTIYKTKDISLKYKEFLSDENFVVEVFCKKFKKILKKYFCNNIPPNLNFKPSNNIFKGLRCGNPTGEEIEFLTKIL